jgi:hypothetical protein
MPAPGIGLAGIARASLSGNIVFTHDQPHKVRGLQILISKSCRRPAFRLILQDATICRHFTLGDGGDPHSVEFSGADNGPIAAFARLGTIPPDCDSARLPLPWRRPRFAPSQTNIHRGPPEREQRGYPDAKTSEYPVCSNPVGEWSGNSHEDGIH